MEWQPNGDDNWSADINEHSKAEIMARPQKGFTLFKIVLRGKSGSIASAQARVEAIVARLGVEAEARAKPIAT